MHPLLEKLNLAFPGLEKVKTAADQNNVSRALSELVTYFRNREEPDPTLLAKANADVIDAALKGLAHEFVFYNEQGTVPGSVIDWTWKPGIDWEWTWALNRHGWWSTLASAYLTTQDETYAQELDTLIQTWVGGHPPTVDDRSCWRTIEAGIRTMSAWPSILGALKQSDNISQNAWLYYLRSISDHAEFLLENPKGGNWLLMESNGVLTCGLIFPEFKRAQDWVRITIEKFEAEMIKQVHPDGAQVEYSTGYQFVCIHNFEAVLDKTDRIGNQKFSQTYRDYLISMYEHVMYLMRPDGKLPMLNDADQRDVSQRLIAAGEKFARPDFIYAATHGVQGAPPQNQSHRFSWSRRAVMRNGWDENAHYALLEAAPFGYGHQHEDALTFELMAYGQPLIGTMGRFTYADVPERRYLTSSRGHNVILIDGQGQAMRSLKPQDRMNPNWIATAATNDPWVNTEDLDIAYGKFDGPWGGELENITWERWLAYHKPKDQRLGFWIVKDHISGTTKHDLEFLLHFFPGEISWNESQGTITTDYGAESGNVLVKFPDTKDLRFDAACGRKDPARGWFSQEYGKIQSAYEMATHRQVQLPYTHHMVFVPFKETVPEIDISISDNHLEVSINNQIHSVDIDPI
jgi:hypothetical protein